MQNPFKYGCVVEGGHFCPRPELSRRLRDYIARGQNLVVQGDRRIGKSSLVKNTIKGMRGYHPLMIDLMGVKNVSDICNRVAAALISFDDSDSIIRRVVGLFAHLKPVVSVDAITGMPTISVDRRSSEDPSSISVALKAIVDHVKGRRACVVLDEFQDILDLKDGEQVLSIMRGVIQHVSEVSFVYLGSSRDEMLNIFMSPKSPFYKSALLFAVEEFEEKALFEFVSDKFKGGKRKLDAEFFHRIWEFVQHTTGDVQEFCDALWTVTQSGDRLGDVEFGNALEEIFRRESFSYATFIKNLTDIQFRVLKALAELGGEHPLSSEFLNAAHITTHASVNRSLTSLCNAGLIYPQSGDHKFMNPFFKEWVRRVK